MPEAECRWRVIAATLECFGRIDVLVNVVGANSYVGPLVEIDLDVFPETIDLNLVVALGWIQEPHRAWMGLHGGAIVNVASAAGIRVRGSVGAYSIIRAALLHVTAQLALELRPEIRVNAVAPALIETPFTAEVWAADEKRISTAYLLQRLREADDVGAAITFLGGADSGWITGQTFLVDGGLLLTIAAPALDQRPG